MITNVYLYCTYFELSENEGYTPDEFERIFSHYENICCSLDYNAENNKMKCSHGNLSSEVDAIYWFYGTCCVHDLWA